MPLLLFHDYSFFISPLLFFADAAALLLIFIFAIDDIVIFTLADIAITTLRHYAA
jgi:hypothetical protein